MTLPRRLLPEQTHAVTRRTRSRAAFLRPSPVVNAIVLFALGRALERHPHLALHALFTASNHYHAVLTDRRDPGDSSRLPPFFQDFNSLTARALNAHYGRGENLWSKPGSYNNVEVHGAASLEDQLLYLWSNPVKDGLVPRPEDWPGVWFGPEDFGRELVVERPSEAFFGGRRPADWEPTYRPAREALRRRRRRQENERNRRGRRGRRNRADGRGRTRRAGRGRLGPGRKERRRPPRRRTTLPNRVRIRLEPPPGWERRAPSDATAHFRRLLDARVEAIHAERAERGLVRFLGVEEVLRGDPLDSLGDPFPAFALNPRIACLDTEQRIALLQGLRLWRETYREALELWRSGRRGVRFPLGTYRMVAFFRARLVTSTGPPLA